MSERVMNEKALLAMPEEDYMNEAQLAFFKKLLVEQQAEIRETIAATRDQMADIDTEADPLDMASNQETLQLGLRTSERLTKYLRNIEAALDRIQTNEYGYCEETGEPIGLRRLLARPTATLSIQAKENREYRERTEGVESQDSESDQGFYE